MSRRRKVYPPEIREVRDACRASGSKTAALAAKFGVKTWELSALLIGGHIRLDRANKIRVALNLPELAKVPAPAPSSLEKPAIAAGDDEQLPLCDWQVIAAAAAELSDAAADYQFILDRFQEATYRLRAANRRALAAGIAVAPALRPGGSNGAKADKHTARFFKLLSVGGALS